jgi:glutathione S-transferase
MASYTFFTNPMSRGQIARWALHEVGADYEQVIVEYGKPKPEALLAANGLGKLPTLVHHTAQGEYPIAETSAICAYLAETEADGTLAPTAQERAAYYRWLFFAAGPLEQAITAKSMGFEPNERQKVSVGYGCYDLVVETLAAHCRDNDFVCGRALPWPTSMWAAMSCGARCSRHCPNCPNFWPMARVWPKGRNMPRPRPSTTP